MKQENNKIISKDQYEEYMGWIDMHIFRVDLTSDELKVLDRLTTLVEEYECVHCPTIFDKDRNIIGFGDKAT